MWAVYTGVYLMEYATLEMFTCIWCMFGMAWSCLLMLVNALCWDRAWSVVGPW